MICQHASMSSDIYSIFVQKTPRTDVPMNISPH